MRKLFGFVAMLLSAAATYGQNTLTASSVEIPQSGGNLQLVLTLAEENVYSSYQWKIETPEGLAYVTDEDDDVECTLGTGHDRTHGATAHWNASTRTLGFGVVSTKTALLSGTTVELSIPMAATAAEVGSELQLKFTGVTFIRDTGEKDALDDVTITVTIAEPADTRTVLDETSTSAPEAATAVDVRVKRTINANEWSTICLPFAMTEEQCKEVFGSDVQLGDFTGADSEFDDADNVIGINAHFVDATAIEANHPYIIKVSVPVTEFTLDGVDIVADEDEACVEFDNGKTGSRRVVYSGFYGTYHAGTVLDEFTLFLSSNKFWYSAGKTKMKAFRAYFDFYDVLAEVEEGSAASRIVISFSGHGGTTTDASDASRLMNNEERSKDVYDLQGRRVNSSLFTHHSSLTKGVYVRNGKKIVIK